MTDPMSLDTALAILAGTGRVRIQRIPYERQALKVVRAELDRLRDALADQDHCGEPAPVLLNGTPTWCVRRPGHGVPHRNRDGCEWTEIRNPARALPPELAATVDTAKRDTPGAVDTPAELQARLDELRAPQGAAQCPPSAPASTAKATTSNSTAAT